MSPQEILLRVAAATAAGLCIGLDRELRGKALGLRTNGLISLSSAVTTLSALILFEDLQRAGATDVDPLRVIQGVAQAVGFIAAGAIFVAGGSVRNLTSASTLWLSAAIGVAAGAGQFTLAAIAFGVGFLLLTVIRAVEGWAHIRRRKKTL